MLLLAGLFVLGLSSVTCRNDLIVQTTHGSIKGSYMYTRGGIEVMQFLGVPYATPPVGRLRFKSPKEAAKWTGVKRTTVECPVCMQRGRLNGRFEAVGHEDCLCLNIFTSKTSPSAWMPIIFYIHGLGYPVTTNSRDWYGPHLLLDKDVVLVTAAYRLGVLGFLSTNDPVIPGNWALKDQAAALRWVRANARAFGGNPRSITLMGEGEGAASVQLHMASPSTRDLFHRAVMQSGSALCLWGLSDSQATEWRSSEIARLLGCPRSPSDRFLSCLQRTSGAKIVEAGIEFSKTSEDPIGFWNPVVEGPETEDPFLTGSPFDMHSNKPLLAGFNYGEGMLAVSRFFQNPFDIFAMDSWNADFERKTALNLMFYYRQGVDYRDLSNRVRDFYLGTNQEITQHHLPQLNRMFGDFWYTNGLLDAVERHAGPKYLYHFDYNTSVSVCQHFFKTKIYGGACHMDELMYLFPMNNIIQASLNDNILRDSDWANIHMMVDLWTNFAKNSEPTAEDVDWRPVETPALEHLVITWTSSVMRADPMPERRAFWKSLALTESNRNANP